MEKAYLKDIALDIKNHSIVILIGIEGTEKYVPIWVGNAEAMAIALGKNKIAMPRPLTHDLITSIIMGMGGEVEKIVLTGLKENTYFAMIHIRQGESLVVIDSRPSDSIAVAIRTDAPIYMVDGMTIDPEETPEEDAKIKERLRIINPEDLLAY